MTRINVLLLALALTHMPPLAASSAQDEMLVAYRQRVMEAAKGHLRAARMVAVERLVRPAPEAREHARALAAMGDVLVDLFPPGSLSAESEAREAIWRDGADFERAVSRFREAARAFLAQAGRGEREYFALQEACKGCHDGFRER